MTNLTSRVEFRAILKRIVTCVSDSLSTMAPLTPEEMHFWLREITLDDVRVVMSEIDAERSK